MREFLITLLRCSACMSLVTLAYVAVQPLLAKRYAPKWRYILWLAIAAGWVFPFRPRINPPFLPVPLIDIPAAPVMASAGNIVNTPAAIPVWPILGAVWIAGVLGVIAYHALRHIRFMKTVRRWSEPVSDSERLGIVDGVKAELGIEAPVGLRVCRSVPGPLLVGVFRPVILLPPVNIADDELAFILKHELIHFKRHDLWYKALILAAAALHWFNPVVYLMAGAAALQCEISCDALVLQGADFEKRKRYGETIIGVVRNGVKFRTALSTHFYGGKKGMKSRISSIMDTNRKRTGIAVLCVVLALIMTTGVPLAAAETGDSVTGGININQAGQISTDGGLTWMDAEEHQKTYPAWWANLDQLVSARSQERLEWLVQEKIHLQQLGRALEGLQERVEERIDNTVQRVEQQPEWKEWSEEDKIRLRQKIDNGIQKLEFKWPEPERPEQEYIRPRERIDNNIQTGRRGARYHSTVTAREGS